MAHPAFRSKTFATSSGTGFTASEPSGAAENDLLYMWIVLQNTFSSFVGPTGGWELLYNLVNTNSTTYLYAIRRGASAPNRTCSWTTSIYYEVSLTAWSGCVTSGALYDVKNYTAATQRNPANPNCPSVTTTVVETLVVAFGMGWSGAVSAWTAPSGYTIREAGSAGIDLCIAEKELDTITSEDPGAFSGSVATNNDVAEITVALKPAVVATAAITGTATETIDEADIVAGGKTIIITLTGDTFIA